MSKPISKSLVKGKQAGIASLRTFICLLLLLLISSSQALAAVWYVTPTGAGSQTGLSWDNAFASIQAAVSASSPGDEIWVKGGTYTLPSGTSESLSEILVNKNIGVYGGFAGSEASREQRDWKSNVTTVRGIGYETRIFHLTADATVDGFTITGGRISWEVSMSNSMGAGILVQSNNAVIRNCIVNDNRASISGASIALMGDEDSSSIINTWVSGNFSNYGVGGIIIASGSPKIVNCMIVNNSGENPGGISSSQESSPVITNCTIYGNTSEPSPYGSGVYCRGAATITNCIIWGNQTLDGYQDQITTGAGSTVSYCNIDQDGFEGTAGNIRLDPLFVNPAAGNFHLSLGSPCVDAGTDEAPELPEVDFEGDDRIMGEAVDIGADEYNPSFTDTEPPVITLLGDNPLVLELGTPYIEPGAKATDNVDGDISALVIISNEVNVYELGSYEVTYNVSDSSGNAADEVVRTVQVVDTIAPTFELTTPSDGATNVALNTDIQVHVKDGGSGVAQGIQVIVEGVTVTSSLIISGTAADYTVTYNPASDFTNGQVVDIVVSASDTEGNSGSDTFSFITISGAVGGPTDDSDCDGITDIWESRFGTNPFKKTLFIRPFIEDKTAVGTWNFWSDFKAVLFPFSLGPDADRPGFAYVPQFDNADDSKDIEVSIIGDPAHPYFYTDGSGAIHYPMRELNYDPGLDANPAGKPPCDILEVYYHLHGACPANNASGNTYFNGSDWSWDTKGLTPDLKSEDPDVPSDPYYLKYRYHKARMYHIPLQAYMNQGGYETIRKNLGPLGNLPAAYGQIYCTDALCIESSPMNLLDTESGLGVVDGELVFTGHPDSRVEIGSEIAFSSGGIITNIGPTVNSAGTKRYYEYEVLRRTVLHEIGHALLEGNNTDHCLVEGCIMFGETKNWDPLPFGYSGCKHSIGNAADIRKFPIIHNSTH